MRYSDNPTSIPQALTAVRFWLLSVLLGTLVLTLQPGASAPGLRMDAGGHRVLAGELAKGLSPSRQSQFRPAGSPSKDRDKHGAGKAPAGPAEFPLAVIAAVVSPLPAIDVTGPGRLHRHSRAPRAPPLLHA